MNKSKPYAAVPVNQVRLDSLLPPSVPLPLFIGCDVAKSRLLLVLRFAQAHFCRPWLVHNPSQIPLLVALLSQLHQSCPLHVALEPSGTYGDALRQALHDAHLSVLRVSPKLAHDYAEIFDGVPSQHDGKDAAVIAELAALGKAAPWPYETPPVWQQELAYWVDWLDIHTRQLALWAGRLEALLARHWPEVTRIVQGTSATLLQALAHYGDPATLTRDDQARRRLAGWGGRLLSGAQVERLLVAAAGTVGVRPGPVERTRLQEYARQTLAVRQQIRRSRAALRRLSQDQQVLQAQATVVGHATACVLWATVGDPREYSCGAAYRKALGLNLTEHSSGQQQGPVHISKRGHSQARRWLYLAALRLVQQEPVKQWYQARKTRDGNRGKRALVALMRKLAVALYQVGAQGAEFAVERLLASAAVTSG